jgi:hypothetical protein
MKARQQKAAVTTRVRRGAKKKAPKRPRGRPPEPVPERWKDAILRHLEGGGLLSDWCRVKGHPSTSTVWDWRLKDAQFAGDFAKAMEIGCHAMLDEGIRIARTPMEGERIEEIETVDDEGEPITKRKVIREDNLGHRKLLSWTLLQYVARRRPDLFGSRVEVKHEGKVTLESLVEQSLGDDVEAGDAGS